MQPLVVGRVVTGTTNLSFPQWIASYLDPRLHVIIRRGDVGILDLPDVKIIGSDVEIIGPLSITGRRNFEVLFVKKFCRCS